MKLCSIVMAGLLIAGTAQAHIVASPDQGVAGSYFQTSLRVSHGCEGSPTTELHVAIPDGILTVHPQHKPGWKLKIIRHTLDHAMPTGHGAMATEAIDEIIWYGNSLSSDEYDDFGLLMKLPDAAEQVLWFPTTQICTKGRNAWVEIPADGQAWHDVHAPAPFVRVLTPAAN